MTMRAPPPPWPEEGLVPPSRPATQEDRTGVYVALGGLLAAYLTLGLLWAAFADNVPWADADFYFRGAKSIAEGDGYSHPFKETHPPTAFHPVGYPWLLGHVWKVLGIETRGCDLASWPAFTGCGSMVQAAQVVNVILATANIGLVFVLGSLLKGPRIGLLSAAVFALIPSRLFFSSAVMSEESFVTLVLLALIMLVLGVQKRDYVWLTTIGFGLAVGAAAFIRPLGIVLLGLPLVLLFRHTINARVAFGQLALAATIAFVILLPWELRNHREVGGWNFVSNNGGINLWIGCHLDSEGKLASNGQWMDWWSGSAPRSLNTPDERANDAEAQRLGLECMREEPLGFLRLSLVKALYTFREDWTYVSKWAINHSLPEQEVTPIVDQEAIDALTYLTNGVYLLLLPLAAVGAVTTLFAPSLHRGVLGMSFAALALIPLLFFGEPRFHVPLFPIMSIWAAEGSWILFRALRRLRHEPVEQPEVREVRPRVTPYEWREEPWPR